MTDLTGQRLGQYQILSRVAKGSVATIYKAYQAKLDRYVAVKVLSAEVIDEEGFLDRFTQEARAIAQLDHPNIVPVYDFDRLGDTVYLVMKYVEGGTLKELLTGQPLDLGLTLELVSQVGLALGYAHKRGVVHRDVKPSNVLVAEGHWALLTDFGLAKMIAGDKKLTRPGIGMGTPDYMAPEQAQGFPLDHRADLYSLGATLYEMLTGRVPFYAESSMAVIVKHMTEPPSPPRELNPNLTPALERVVLRALEKDPDKRYQTAEEFIGALVKAIRPVRRQVMPDTSAAAQGISGVAHDFRPAPNLPSPVEGLSPPDDSYVPKPAMVVTPARSEVARHTVGPQPRPRTAGQAKRSRATLWSKKLYRIMLLIVSVLAIVLIVTSVYVAIGLRQLFASSTAPTATMLVTAPPLPVTPTGLPPTEIPTLTPKPTASPTPAPTPTATPVLRPIPPDTPIHVGIYVKAVRPDACLRRNAGYNEGCFVTVSLDSVLYVLRQTKVDNLDWVYVGDWVTGSRGWDAQVNYAAYAVPAATPAP